LVSFLAWLAARPVRIEGLAAVPRPAANYEEALARVHTIQVEELGMELLPVCQTRLLAHGGKTAKVIVFLHGFTSCPQQFAVLGQEFYERGYNVFLPRQPFHGQSDRRPHALSALNAEKMIAWASAVADIAAGLGEEVTVAGLSGGGTLVLWLAQHRADIHLAAALAPFLGVGFIPAPLTRLFMKFLLTFPDHVRWWDPRTGARNPLTTYYAYPGYTTHSLGEVLRVGDAVMAAARQAAPGAARTAARILVVTNGNDRSVNNQVTARLVKRWRESGANVLTYKFERELGLPHDIISPDRPDQNINVVYPVLVRLLEDCSNGE
jgi:carboxylesterase